MYQHILLPLKFYLHFPAQPKHSLSPPGQAQANFTTSDTTLDHRQSNSRLSVRHTPM
jgi:hypothetical protein